MGNQDGHSHESEPARLAYMGEVLYGNNGLSITENNPKWGKDQFIADVKRANRVPKVVCGGPDYIGWPALGDRMLMATINEAIMLWVGSPSTDVTSSMMSIFGARVDIDGSVFINTDTLANLLRYREELASHLPRGRRLEGGLTDQTPTGKLLNKSGSENLDAYKKIFNDPNNKRIGRNGCFICDVSQNPEHRIRCGAWVPRPQRSAQLVCPSEGDALVTAAEGSASQGWPCTSLFPSDLRAILNWDISGFDCLTQRQILGEGFHVPYVTAFIWFILANCVKREDAMRMPPQIRGHVHLRLTVMAEEAEDVDAASSGDTQFDFQSVEPGRQPP